MDPVLLVGIISGGSAIAASVGAQAIGAWLGHKADRERRGRDDDRRSADRAERQSERFDDNKRAAFVRYLQIRNEYRRICHRLYMEQHTQDRVQRLKDRARYAGSDLEALVEEIGLIDPDVYDQIALLAIGPIMEIDANDTAGLEQWFLQDSLAVLQLRMTMRNSLAIAPRSSGGNESASISVAPASRDRG